MKMKIKSKPATPTVAVKKTKTRTARTCAKKTTTAAPASKAKAKVEETEKNVTLTCRFEPGREVYAVGTFNNWQLWDKSKKMTDKKKDGVYSITLRLQPGRYEYKFFLVTNGKGDWTEDVQNVERVQNAMGTYNSVLNVE